MASAKQITWRKKFAKLYGKKKKGSKSTNLEKKSVDVKKLKKYSKSAKDEYDTLYEQDRKEWKRLKALAKKRGW
tara:strand:- start:1893 stop:2114 length:222 start_codon:yes stop_codon:yes gene_type:complete